MPRHRAKPRSERLSIGTTVKIRPNQVHPRLAGYRGELVAYTAGTPAGGGAFGVTPTGVSYYGGNPIVQMGEQRFLFRPEDLEVLWSPDQLFQPDQPHDSQAKKAAM